VFDSKAEMETVCNALGCDMSEVKRTTGGLGITVVKTDFVAGDKLSLHFFFEGGRETAWTPNKGTTDETSTSTTFRNLYVDQFIFRTALGFDYIPNYEGGALGLSYFFRIGGQRGAWPIMGGDLSRPEEYQSYDLQIGKPAGYSVVVSGGIKF